MGVSIETWRARIGSYGGGSGGLTVCTPSASCSSSDSKQLVFTLLSVTTIYVLLTIGGVETNPGPTFECKRCVSRPQKFSTPNEHVLHQKSHMNEKNFVFVCPICELNYATINAITLHLLYFHGEVRNSPQEECIQTPCNVTGCDSTFPSSKLLCQHLKKDHQAHGVSTQCPFKESCHSQHYFNKQTFSVHLSQYHKGWNISGGALPDVASVSAPFPSSVDQIDLGCNMDIDLNDELDDVSPSSAPESAPANAHVPHGNLRAEKILRLREEFHQGLSTLYLRLESLHFIPVSTINVIAKSVAELSAINMVIMRETAESVFEDLALPQDQKERAVNNILAADCIFSSHHKDTPGPTMTTNALRKSYYKTHFQYFKPKEINISHDPNDRRCIYYCRIKKTLESFISHSEVQEQIVASFNMQSEDGIYKDYKDGSLHKKRKEKSPERSIDLLIFQDEFTPTKDLSSVANQYKILGVYYTVGNLCPHLRAKLDCKKLIMLVPDSKNMFSDFKLELFSKLLIELKELQRNGVTFMGEKVKVRLRFLLGDNKGQHEIGGFIQSFSSEYFCRYCEMTKTEINAEPWKVGPLRTPQSYEEASELVPPGRATFKGVSRPEWQCPFNELEDFHVCDPGLVPCIGHDHYEGVINYDLSLMLQYFVQKKWFTYDQLNRRIKIFNYHGHDSGNKPAPVKYDKKSKKEKKEPSLGGHAIQNWTLLRLLPLILDDDFIKDTNNPYWQLYLSLKQITEMLCSPSINHTQIGQLKVMIEEYKVARQPLLGDGKPKHHYLSHYADLIEMTGPLVHLCGLGFEQFHQFFKNAAKSGKNFSDLGMSLIKKYCLYLAYLSRGSPFVTGIKILESGVKVAEQKTMQPNEEFETVLKSKNIPDYAFVMKKIQIDDLVFKEKQWLLLGNKSDLEIVAAVIHSVVLNGNSVFLVLEQHIATYLPNVGIYHVNERSCGLICLPREEIVNPIPQSMYEWGSYDKCFSLKHSLCNTAPLN